MRKIWIWLKWDYKKVTEAWFYIFDRRVPNWIPTVIYVLLAPIGLVLYPFAIIISKILLARWNRKLDKWLELEED